MTSTIPVQRSSNWAIKPTESWSRYESVIIPVYGEDTREYHKIHQNNNENNPPLNRPSKYNPPPPR